MWERGLSDWLKKEEDKKNWWRWNSIVSWNGMSWKYQHLIGAARRGLVASSSPVHMIYRSLRSTGQGLALLRAHFNSLFFIVGGGNELTASQGLLLILYTDPHILESSMGAIYFSFRSSIWFFVSRFLLLCCFVTFGFNLVSNWSGLRLPLYRSPSLL